MLKVLDHGFVRLVSYMQPAKPLAEVRGGDICIDEWSGDLEVVRNARVSYDADWREGDDKQDAGLVNYLTKNRHTSPFEAMVFTFEVKSPIFVLRQWHRHRTWSYNEVSARYTELPEEFYIPKAEHVGTQSTSNKQMRVLEEAAGLDEVAVQFIKDLQEHSAAGFRFYKKHLAAGVPRELARLFLGLNTYSRMFATVDLHNLFHFLTLRLHSHSQHEIRVYAEALLKLIEPICPVAVAAFKEHRL